MLTAFAKTPLDIKPKVLAIVYSVYQGKSLQAQTTGQLLKKYSSIGACLNDRSTLNVINKELIASGFQPVKIVNPTVLAPINYPIMSHPL